MTVSPGPHTTAPAIRTRVWRNGVLEKENFPFEHVADYAADEQCLVWADLADPSETQLAAIAAELHLDAHAAEDAAGERERPKATRYPSHVFLTAYTLGERDGSVVLRRVSAFCTARCLLTVRLGDSVDIDAVVRRWDDEPQLLQFGPSALVYGLLDEVVDRYLDVVQDLDDRIEDLEDILFAEQSEAGREVSRRCYELRRELVRIRRAIVPMRDVVNTVMRGAVHDEKHQLAPYFGDLYDHAMRAAEWSDTLRDTLTSIFETNMSLADTRMNTIMKKLTSWAAIIAVPTAVTGFYGQNVPYPGFGDAWGFWFSSVAIVLIAVALYGVFKRKDWL